MNNLVQNDSKHMDYTPAVNVASGELVNIGGGRMGVAVDAILANTKGVLIMSDVVITVPKAVTATGLTAGAAGIITSAANTVLATAGVTMTNGYIWKAAAAADTTAELALK